MRPPRWQLTAAIAVFGVGYLLQTASALRLDSDSVVYLYAASRFADGSTPGVDVPLGYSVFLAALDRWGIASAFFFVLANCAFLALGLFCLWHLASESQLLDRRWILLLSLASVPIIHAVALALPEPAYLGISLLALLCMRQATVTPRSKQILLLAAAALLSAFAISLRNAGVALLPALLLTVFQARFFTSRRSLLMLVGALAAMTVAVVIVVSGTTAVAHSIYQARVYFPHGLDVRKLPVLLFNTLIGTGEMISNVPYSRFKQLQVLYLLIGALSAAFLLFRFRPARALGPVGLYTLSYLAILFFWPYPSPRLWMPILPLLIAYGAPAAYALARSGRASLFLLRAYACWFILTGAVALVYTSRISIQRGDSKYLVTRMADSEPEHAPLANVATFDQMLSVVIRRYAAGQASRGGI